VPVAQPEAREPSALVPAGVSPGRGGISRRPRSSARWRSVGGGVTTTAWASPRASMRRDVAAGVSG
jgi:hypothetical protein